MIIETVSAVLILCIAIIFLNPGHLSMPNNVVSMLTVGLIVSFLTFSAYLFKETSRDEREATHILVAGRLSYLVGVAALVTGIIIQSFKHNIDPWLVIALCAMIFSKLISRIYSNLKM